MSARRLFPYVATFVALLVVGAIFVIRPTPFIGVTPGGSVTKTYLATLNIARKP